MTSDKKLEIPHYCIIPYSVRIDDSIPDAAKIYCGELHVLSAKEGYIYGSDEQLAEMKNKSISTIERWNHLLENGGHIVRDTFVEPYTHKEGRLLWKTKRKIYMTQPFQEKNADPSKIRGPMGPIKNKGLSELDNHEQDNSQEAGKPASGSEELKSKVEQLKKLPLAENQIMAIGRNYGLDNITKAVEMALETPKIDSLYSWLTKCMREKWWLTSDPEKTKGGNFFKELKRVLSTIRQGGTSCKISIEDNRIDISTLEEGGFEISRDVILKLESHKTLVDSLNKRFLSTKKLKLVTVEGNSTLEIVDEDKL
jgi:hypothetical protein